VISGSQDDQTVLDEDVVLLSARGTGSVVLELSEAFFLGVI
jgi:hypothetical protein